MTIRRSSRDTRREDTQPPGPLARAVDARDFERVVLLVMLAAIDLADSGDIEDVIDLLAGREARDGRA